MVVLTVTLPHGRCIPLTDALDLGEAQQTLNGVRDLFEDPTAIAEGWRTTQELEGFGVSRGSFSAVFALVTDGETKNYGSVPSAPAMELTGHVTGPGSAAATRRRPPPGG